MTDREARTLRRQLRKTEEELNNLRARLESPQILSTGIDEIIVKPSEYWIVETAKRLNHYVMVRPVYNTTEFKLRVMAVRP